MVPLPRGPQGADVALPLTGERTVPGIASENYWFLRARCGYLAQDPESARDLEICLSASCKTSRGPATSDGPHTAQDTDVPTVAGPTTRHRSRLCGRGQSRREPTAHHVRQRSMKTKMIALLLALTAACGNPETETPRTSPASASARLSATAQAPDPPQPSATPLLVSERQSDATYDQAAVLSDTESAQSAWELLNLSGTPPRTNYSDTLLLVATFGVDSCVEDVVVERFNVGSETESVSVDFRTVDAALEPGVECEAALNSWVTVMSVDRTLFRQDQQIRVTLNGSLRAQVSAPTER